MTDNDRLAVLRAAGFPGFTHSPLEPEPPPAAKVRPAPAARAPKSLALIATRNYLPFAKLTASSFTTYHSGFEVFLLLVDGEQADAAYFPEGHIVLLRDLELPQAGWCAAKFTASEFTNALKPVFLQYLTRLTDQVIYLDCDIVVFSHMTELVDRLNHSPLVLVPHMVKPPPRPEQFWVHPTRADTFNAGLINAGSFAIDLLDCSAFLAFWREANLGVGAFYEGAGYQTDQQHLNWAMTMVPDTSVLLETRYNVAYWNLHDRDLRLVDPMSPAALDFEVDGRPLAFFHFSGYDIYDRLRISRHDGRHSVYNLPAIAALLNWYSDAILASSAAPLLHDHYGFETFANGFTPTKTIRELLKRHEAHLPRSDSLTKAGADELCRSLMTPLPAAGSLLPLIAADIYANRPDLRDAFPHADTDQSPSGYWRWFCRHAGVELGVQFLSDRFRQSLVSDSLLQFAGRVKELLGESNFQFLGPDRVVAAERLRESGHDTVADILLEGIEEWYYFSDLGAALEMYTRRPGLQHAFPDPLGADHEAFCDWLLCHGRDEHGCSSRAGQIWKQHKASETLARIYSYLARRPEVAEACHASLLSDDIGPCLLHLIRGAGDGLEYNLDDVVILRYIHQTQRHLLVPVYLELPLIRRRPDSSRTAKSNVNVLPEAVRTTAWALRGCRLHAECFEPLEAYMDAEMHRWASQTFKPAHDVLGFLRTRERGASLASIMQPAHNAAVAQARKDPAVSPEALRRKKAAEQQPTTNVFGYFLSDIGVGESSRGLAQAVSLLRPVNRVPLHTGQLQDGTKLQALFQRFNYQSDTNVFVSYPHQSEDLLGLMPPEFLIGRRNVIHLAWEQKDANPWWKRVYDRYDEIWIISEFAATSFRKMFPERVRIVPNVLNFEQFPDCHDAAMQRLKSELVCFLFAFDANSSVERKNPEGLIDAFVKAFKDTALARRVRLTLKIGGMHRAEHAERVRRLRQQASESKLDIYFDSRQLDRAAMLRLIAGADCYVSLHRAEGFGYTLAEAMAYGVPVIASGYSGNLEYMTPSNSFLVPCSETFVKEADGPFQRGSIWGEPHIDAAVSMLRSVVEQPANALSVGECGRKTVWDKLSAATIATELESFFHPSRKETPSRIVVGASGQ